MADFLDAVQNFKKAISDLKDSKDTIEEAWDLVNGSDSDKKSAADQAFREVISEKLQVLGHQHENGNGEVESAATVENGDAGSGKIEIFQKLIKSIISHAQQKKCAVNLPILLMSDVFDALTLKECEVFFNFVEENVEIWTTEPFFTTGKNYLLRMCNDILRRLSKSLNTIFCGRIQLFLACLFPIEEKSALNIMSQFHVENLTVYKKTEEEFHLEPTLDSDMETDEGEVIETNSPIDFHLYVRFWCLQDFFRHPSQCFIKPDGWKKFKTSIIEVYILYIHIEIKILPFCIIQSVHIYFIYSLYILLYMLFFIRTIL